jgi:hypothetical protein
MVKAIFFILLLAPTLIFSGEFVASVSSNQVNVSENLILSLVLKDVSATSTPSINLLNELFHINSQQQYQNTSMINGTMSSSTTWKISLTPKKMGEIIIPAFTINTSEGILTSHPITINVDKANPNDPNASGINGITSSIILSKLKPYKNEPFLFTTKVVSKHNLLNVKIQNFTVNDAIVELSGEPKIQKRIVDGVKQLKNPLDLYPRCHPS